MSQSPRNPQWPLIFNPLVSKPFRDTGVALSCWRVELDNTAEVAAWCGGETGEDADGPLVQIAGTAARPGDLVAHDGSTYRVIPGAEAGTTIWCPESVEPGDPPPITEWYRLTIPGY